MRVPAVSQRPGCCAMKTATKVKVAVGAVVAFVALDVLAISTGYGDAMGPVFMLPMLLVMVAAYLAPTIIANSRNIPNAGAVAVINVLLGWTFLGWIVALAMSVGGTARPPTAPVAWPATKVCPDCAETVLADARVCKHCGYRFAPATSSEPATRPPATPQPVNRPKSATSPPGSKSLPSGQQNPKPAPSPQPNAQRKPKPRGKKQKD